ncbi:MarR family winged helix-turn-helix transcriptional regulator [Lacibacterium aquatile]|uniref:MarR family winged helix-turn-helix transcriptional regulator n=1 Tax=Lacibacterium aquatile TaxID=1168082 RepID=A0ABW5DSR1_9PROT
MSDHVDRLRAQWARELPDLDTTPMAVFGRMLRLVNLMGPGIEATFASYGLDRGEFDVLATLRRSGPPYRLTPTEMYRSLMIASGSLTHRLARLEKAGLIRRAPSESDGRSLSAELTEAGIACVEAAFREDMGKENAALSGIDPAELADLAARLKALTLAVEANLKKGQPE